VFVVEVAMILGIEIAMIVVGLIALFRGKLTISKTKVVEGIPARLLGLLALTPIPVVIAVGLAYTILSNPADPEKFVEENKTTLVVIEVVIVLGIAILVFGIGAALGKDPTARRRDEEEDEYDDERDDRDRRDDRAERDDYDDRPRRKKNPWE
jgi:hypothetical protein